MKNVNKILYRLVAILMVSVLASTCLLCGLLAKYSTSGSGTDSARVIKFGDLFIAEEGNFVDGTAVLVPGIDLTKDVTVRFNGSEASTIVFVEMNLSEFLTGSNEMWVQDGNKFSLKLLNANSQLIDALSFSVLVTTDVFEENSEKWYFLEKSDTGAYIYYKVLTPNMKLVKNVGNADEVDGSFIDLNGKLSVGTEIPTVTVEKDSEGNYVESKYAELLKTKINFKVTTVQANGFESVSDAWLSVK